MFTTFNMGVGLIVIVPEDQSEQALEILSTIDVSYRMGIVEEAEHGSVEIIPYEVTIE